MTTTLTFTEDAVHRFAPDDDSLKAARDLIRKKSFLKPGISSDSTWLLGQCKGSGKNPYEVSVDLADQSLPTFRCNCPSRKFPCKHGLGLLLLYVQSPAQFDSREPDEDLLSKREKKVARAEKKKTEDGAEKPKKVNVAALAKKVAAQREGLDLLEKLVVDLVAGGQWYEESRLQKLDSQSKQMADAYLPGAMFDLRQLVVLGRQEGLTEEERTAQASDLIGQLWATVQKGRNYLDDKLAGDENQAEVDAVIENVIGRAWQLTELKEKGYWKTNLSLLELAFERIDDEARQQRVEISHQVELADGSIYQAIAYRPFKGMAQIAEQPSYMQAVKVAEAAVYPGFINRRVRWEKGGEQVEELKPEHLKKAYDAARPDFKAAIDAYKQQVKHPLAPRDAVMLFRCAKIGKVGAKVVLEDAAGLRIEAVDRRKDYSNVANLGRAAGMLGPDRPALLLRLFLQPLTATIVGEPLAALTPKHHLRLGL
jgi:hypothetical protein